MLLETTHLVYYKILFAIWQAVIYYSDLFEYEAPLDLFHMYNKIIHIGYWSFLYIEFPANMEERYNAEKIRKTLREYLNIVLLPQSEVPPYSTGDEVVESLYLQSVRYDTEKGNLNLGFLYINNKEAFKLYKENKKYE